MDHGNSPPASSFPYTGVSLSHPIRRTSSAKAVKLSFEVECRVDGHLAGRLAGRQLLKSGLIKMCSPGVKYAGKASQL